MTHEHEIRAQEAASERGEINTDAEDDLWECDACGTMTADPLTQMTYAGEGTFCPTCRAMDYDD